MHVKAHLDVDMVAVEATDKISLMLDLTAPMGDAQKTRPGQAVQVVLDRSGSMSGERLQSAKFSLLKLIDRLAPQDSFGLVAFDDQALVIAPMRTMADHDLAALKKVIRDMNTGGQTDLSAGYFMGLRELSRANTNNGATLLLISDGHANAGIKDPAELAAVATKHATSNITTSSIGIGNGYDEKILEAIARGGSGQHRFAYSIDEAIGAIAAEVNDLLEKSAVNALLRVTPVLGLASPKIEIVQNLPYWKDNDTYVVQLGDLYAGENRRFFIDFEVPGMAALGLCKIADITLEYLNLEAMSEVSVTMPVQVNVVPEDVAKGRVIDPIVAAERLVLTAQAEKKAAIDELQQGNNTNAATRLKSTAENLRRRASEIAGSDERTMESIQIIRTEADEIEQLAGYAEYEDANYAVKRNMESLSRGTRSRKLRNQPTDPSINTDELN
jgi:Ca-activated chloride channel family protein